MTLNGQRIYKKNERNKITLGFVAFGGGFALLPPGWRCEMFGIK